MSKNLKALSAALVLLMGLLSLSVLVSADSDLYDITKVKVNDVEMTSGGSTTTQVELDDTTEVEVYLEGTGNATTCTSGVDDCAIEVRVKAWIGGYEYDDIESSSSQFDIEPGVSYKKTLSLDIPEDLDVEDNDYTLYVEVYDDEDSEREDFDLFAERADHNLNIVDVLYDSSVDAGDATSVEVRVENLGEEKEEDIKVEVSLAGNTAIDYINELASFEEDNEEEESSDSATVSLSVDDDLSSDYYDLLVTITYNRGHDSIEESYKVWVDGEDSDEEEDEGETSESEVTVSVSSSDIEGTAGEETSLTLTFTNAGSEEASYSVNVNGEEQWADSDVSPESVTVEAGESEAVIVTLTPEDDASGDYEFSLQILNENGELQEEVDMEMSVEEEKGLFGDTNTMLKVGFILLIVLIILIGLIVAFRKLKDDDDDEELEPKEGKTYY